MSERHYKGDEECLVSAFVDLDQLLARATASDLAADHPLGVLHQTLLRRSLSRNSRRQPTRQEVRNTVFEYWHSPLMRQALLDELREANLSAPAQRREISAAETEGPLAGQASATPILDTHEVGDFLLRQPLRREGIVVREIIIRKNASSSTATALYTYRAAGADAAWLPPEIAVTVLAGTLKWIAEQGLPQCASQTWPIRELQRDLFEHLPPHSFNSDAWFENACSRILAARNAGSILSGLAGDSIRGMLAEMDIPAELVSSLKSAQGYDLGAWCRLREGEGSANDLVFVLADIFANIAAARALDTATQNLLRAFSWAFVPVTVPASQPTGAALFQRFAREQQYRGLLNLVGDIFRLFHLEPLRAAHKLADMETAAWLHLRERAGNRA